MYLRRVPWVWLAVPVVGTVGGVLGSICGVLFIVRYGASLDTILSQQRMDGDEPVILVLHAAEPRVEYQDRGKSSVVIEQ